MKRWSDMHYNDRFAIGILAVLGLGPLISSAILRQVFANDWMIGLLFSLSWGLIWLCALIAAIVAMVQGDGRPSSDRHKWLGRALPLLSLAGTALLVWEISNLAEDSARRTFAAAHEAALGGAPPKAAIYSEGIPDGGTAIIRSPNRNPESFDGGTNLTLTGGNIRNCERLDAGDWFCWFG